MLIYEIILGNHIRTLYRHYTDHLTKCCGFIQNSICNKINLSQERCCKRGAERGKNNCHEELKKQRHFAGQRMKKKKMEFLPLESRNIRSNRGKVKIQWIIPIYLWICFYKMENHWFCHFRQNPKLCGAIVEVLGINIRTHIRKWAFFPRIFKSRTCIYTVSLKSSLGSENFPRFEEQGASRHNSNSLNYRI